MHQANNNAEELIVTLGGIFVREYHDFCVKKPSSSSTTLYITAQAPHLDNLDRKVDAFRIRIADHPATRFYDNTLIYYDVRAVSGGGWKYVFHLARFLSTIDVMDLREKWRYNMQLQWPNWNNGGESKAIKAIQDDYTRLFAEYLSNKL